MSARLLGLLLLLWPLARGYSAAPAAASEDEVEARNVVLGLAGAFSNDGFKIRDGHWTGELKPHEHAVIAVNLYAGNQYWFCVGGTDKAKKLTVELFDESGRRVTTEGYQEGAKAAAGFSPQTSGQYFVRLGLEEGEPGSVCLVYCYK